MQLYFLILLSIALLFFGVSSLRSDSKSKTNRYFLLFILSVIIWIFSNYLSNTISIYWIALISNRLIFFSTTLLSWILFLFASVYPNSNKLFKKIYYILSGIFTLVVLIIDLTPYVVESISIESGYSSIVFGLGVSIYVLHFIFFFFLFIYLLIKKYKKAVGLEKVQLQYLLLGIVLTALGAGATNLILPVVFKIFSLSNYGPVFLIIFVGFTFTSIVRHRFLGIRFLLGRIIFFSVVSIFSLVSFFLLAFLATKVFGGVFETNTILATFAIAPIYAWGYLKFSSYIQKLIEERVVYTNIHPTEILSKFLRATSTQLDMDKIAVYVINTVRKYLNLEKVGIILFEKDSSKVIYKRLLNFKLEGVRDLLQVIQYWKDIGEDPILVLEEAKKIQAKNLKDPKKRLERVIKCMEDEGISAIFPLNRKVQLNGIIVVGKKKNSDPFSVEDMNFLEDIIANASVAMGRAILYKEVESFNSVLKIKVAEQTKDLKEKVTQLNEARRKEHDMIDIMGHELRTPMTIIRNYQEILNNYFEKEGLYKGRKWSKKSKEYMDIIEENIDREIALINVLLSATKLDDGKLVLNKEGVNISDVIQDGILGHEVDVKEKGLYIKFNQSDEEKVLPQVFADRVRIQEVVDNLLGNAVKYTNEGGIDINVIPNEKYMKIEIVDTGIGIPPQEIKHIGKKFYRSNQYISGKDNSMPLVRPGGTGLGLFVTFGLIKAHGGEVEVKSKLGKGSTFSFTIPLFKKEHEHNLHTVKDDNGDMFKRLGLKRK